jgi:hypothetical protein
MFSMSRSSHSATSKSTKKSVRVGQGKFMTMQDIRDRDESGDR